MTFLATPRFPTGISYGSEGGPVFQTSRAQLRSGKEIKNRDWPYPLQQFNVLPGIKTPTELEDVREYFYVLGGADGTMRYKDFSDWKSCALGDTPAQDDQVLGTGDGANRDFEISKTYTKGALSLRRPIDGALPSTLLVEVDGVLATSSDYTFTTGTRNIQFTVLATPSAGAIVKAGYEMDVIVSFGSDTFNVVIESCNPGTGDLIFNMDRLLLIEDRA